MDGFTIFISAGMTLIMVVGGYGLVRHGQKTKSPEYFKKYTLTGLSASILGVGMIIIGIMTAISLLYALRTQNPTVHISFCNIVPIFYIALIPIAGILEGVRRSQSKSKQKRKKSP
jgi:hypothetical protein